MIAIRYNYVNSNLQIKKPYNLLIFERNIYIKIVIAGSGSS